MHKYIVACHLPRGSKLWWRENMSGGLPNARGPRIGWSLQPTGLRRIHPTYNCLTQAVAEHQFDRSVKFIERSMVGYWIFAKDTNSNKITNNDAKYMPYVLLILVENEQGWVATISC